MYARALKLPTDSFFLFGARGTGKTTLLERALKPDFSVELLSQENFILYSGDPGLFRRQLETLPPGAWVWVDEIQVLPQLLNEVHWAIEKKQLKFALSGSSARKLKKAGVNLLGGRAESKTLYPFIPSELGPDFNLEQVIQYGSIPLVFAAADKKQRLKSYVHSYLREEIQTEALVRDLPAFVRFLKVAALLHAQTLSLSSVARDVGVKRPSVENYFSILEDTLLAHRLEPFEAELRVKERKHPKFYWIDPGLVRALREDWGQDSPEEYGRYFEGLVFILLKAAQSYFGAFDEIYYWATKDVEVDFLIKNGRQLTAIEAKSSTRFRPEDLKGLKSIKGLSRLNKRILVKPSGPDQKLEDGIEVLSFQTFQERLLKQTLF